MRTILSLIAAFAVVCSLVLPASAQQAGVRRISPDAPAARNPEKRTSMKVVLVRSSEPGCEPDCPEWIAAQGQIDSSTPDEFRRAFAKLGPRKVPVLIDSIGGEVEPSLAIGRIIRARGLDVVVTKTIIETCDAAQPACKALKARGFEPGRPEPRISKCASACAFVLAGGVRRYVGAWTVVGLHEIKSVSTLRLVRQHYRIERRTPWSDGSAARRRLVKEEVLKVETREGPAEEATYERVRRYFAEMGIDQSVMAILRAAPNTSIRWVKVAELKSTGLATEFINGEQLLTATPRVATTEIAAVTPPVAPACEDANPAKPPCTTASVATPTGIAAQRSSAQSSSEKSSSSTATASVQSQQRPTSAPSPAPASVTNTPIVRPRPRVANTPRPEAQPRSEAFPSFGN